MAKYAFRDKERTNPLFASDATSADRNQLFYCPNPDCSAHMYICAMDGSRNAYFGATKRQFPHIPMCPYSSNNVDFDHNRFAEDEFHFDIAIENLITPERGAQGRQDNQENHPEGEDRPHPPHTLNQIYALCKSYDVHHMYADIEISEMILDNRSAYRYPHGCFGNRIIEAQAVKRFYDKTEMQVYLIAPISSNGRIKQYNFILQCHNKKIFFNIRDMIFNNSNNIILVALNCKESATYNNFKTYFNTKKQIYIVKHS